MQDKYVGDIGDFGKYALLKALAKDSLRLAVVWYLNAVPEANQDGKFTAYSHLKHCDAELYSELQFLIHSGKRSTREIERSTILPRATFYNELVPCASGPCLSPARREAQQKIRDSWFNAALNSSAQADIAFLDPDNGIASKNCFKHHRRSIKYVFQDEIEAFQRERKSVILYQHRRRKTLPTQVHEQLHAFASVNKKAFALSFNPGRIYYILPSQDHHNILRERATEFAKGVWNCCFSFIAGDA